MEFLAGIALILNFATGRRGSNQDARRLTETLEQLNVTVVRRDLDGDYVDQEMQSFINGHDFDNYEYVIIAYFSHGSIDEQLLQGRASVQLQKSLLNPLFKVESLRGKLKWCIIQACGGVHDIHMARSDGVEDRRDNQEFFLKSFPTIAGGLSYREIMDENAEHEEDGSVFIMCLCTNLINYRNEDLLTILDHNTRSVEDAFSNRSIMQKPKNVYNFLPRRFFFRTGFEPLNDATDDGTDISE